MANNKPFQTSPTKPGQCKRGNRHMSAQQDQYVHASIAAEVKSNIYNRYWSAWECTGVAVSCVYIYIYVFVCVCVRMCVG